MPFEIKNVPKAWWFTTAAIAGYGHWKDATWAKVLGWGGILLCLLQAWRPWYQPAIYVPTVDPRLAELEQIIVRIAGKRGVKGDAAKGAALARALGLPKTALAVQNDSALPTSELWPGAGESVRDHFLRLLPLVEKPAKKKRKAAAAA